MDVEQMVVSLCQAAKKAARVLARTSTPAKNQALRTAAALLRQRSGSLLAENLQDVGAGRKDGLSAAMLDRLTPAEYEADPYNALLDYTRAGQSNWTGSDTQLANKSAGLAHLIVGLGAARGTAPLASAAGAIRWRLSAKRPHFGALLRRPSTTAVGAGRLGPGSHSVAIW